MRHINGFEGEAEAVHGVRLLMRVADDESGCMLQDLGRQTATTCATSALMAAEGCEFR
jgi:hypothetical protein